MTKAVGGEAWPMQSLGSEGVEGCMAALMATRGQTPGWEAELGLSR